MTESVTDVIVARSRQQDGLRTMVLWSAMGHAVLLVGALLSGLNVEPAPQAPVMTISLSGAPGPKTTGMTQIGARAVQAPSPEPARPVVTPPAATPPKMALPDPKVQPRTQPKPTQAPPESSS